MEDVKPESVRRTTILAGKLCCEAATNDYCHDFLIKALQVVFLHCKLLCAHLKSEVKTCMFEVWKPTMVQYVTYTGVMWKRMDFTVTQEASCVQQSN